VPGLRLHEGFGAAARANAHKVAIHNEGVTWTYEALESASRRLATALREGLGLTSGDRVGLMLTNCPEYFVATLAIARAGLTLVPIPYGSTERELAHFVESSEMRALLTDDAIADRLEDALRNWLSAGLHVHAWERSRTTHSVSRLIEDSMEQLVAPEVDDGSALFYGYTSGSTGRPKAAVISHRARVGLMLLLGQEYGCYTSSDTSLIATPMYHPAGLTRAMAPLIFGGTVVLHSRFDPERHVAELNSGRVTTTFMVPTMFAAIFDLPSPLRPQSRAAITLLSNASALPEHLKTQILEQWPNGRLFEIYGSTECGTVTSLRPEDQLRKQRCVGRPLALNEVRVYDDEMREVPTNEVGQLYSRSPFLFSGYHRDPEATAGAFHDGFATSGDLARIDDAGYVYIVGRRSEVIKSGGVGIYPREVEEVLMAHPAVRDAAVMGVADERWGERVHAVVQLNTGADITEAELLEHCRMLLAPYKLPRTMAFATELPRTGSGKVLKAALAADAR
jgi:long-chain acyl-CoA synthetase